MVELQGLLPEDVQTNIKHAIEDIGLANVIKAVGLDEVIKAAGLDEVIKAAGLDAVEAALTRARGKKHKAKSKPE